MKLPKTEDGFEIITGLDLWAMLACVQCEHYHKCLVAESGNTPEAYTYHADFEEPARTYW